MLFIKVGMDNSFITESNTCFYFVFFGSQYPETVLCLNFRDMQDVYTIIDVIAFFHFNIEGEFIKLRISGDQHLKVSSFALKHVGLTEIFARPGALHFRLGNFREEGVHGDLDGVVQNLVNQGIV